MEKQKTILVVEDNDFVRMQIASFLKSAGYEVLEATEGNAALDVMGDDICLAVVDVRMEPMGGFEFISMIQAEGYDIPVILVTGDQNSTLLEKAGKLGVVTVLMKPVQKERLVSMVERIISRGGH